MGKKLATVDETVLPVDGAPSDTSQSDAPEPTEAPPRTQAEIDAEAAKAREED